MRAQTDGRFGNAWGKFTFLGRVRPWDGLVVLLRTPVRPSVSLRDMERRADARVRQASAEDAHRGRWLFRGYVHDGHWVGRWRETHSAPAAVGYEGAFVLARSADEW